MADIFILIFFTCVDGELSLAGDGACHVLPGASVHSGVFGLSVQDHEGIFRVIVHEGEVTALREKDFILKQTNPKETKTSINGYLPPSFMPQIKTKTVL